MLLWTLNAYRSEFSSKCMKELCVNISYGAFQNLSFLCRSLFIFFWKHEHYKILLFLTRKKWRGLQLYESPERKSGWRFTARLTYRCNEVLLGSKARTLKYFFLPCGPCWVIESPFKMKVYHCALGFTCMNEMCVNSKLGAPQNIELI